MIPKYTQTHPSTSTPRHYPTPSAGDRPAPEPPAWTSDQAKTVAFGQAGLGSPPPPYGPAAGSYTSQLQGLSSEHLLGPASVQRGAQAPPVGAGLARDNQPTGESSESVQQRLSNLKPSHKQFHHSQVQLNHSASNLRFVCVSDRARNRVIEYYTPSVPQVWTRGEALESNRRAAHPEYLLASKNSERSTRKNVDARHPLDPGSFRRRLPSAAARPGSNAASGDCSEPSGSDSSVGDGRDRGLGEAGTAHEGVYLSVMDQLRARLMNDKYYSIKEFSLVHKRRSADNRAARSPLARPGPPAGPSSQGPSSGRTGAVRPQELQQLGTEPTDRPAGQRLQAATQRQPVPRPVLFRMYSIENNLSHPSRLSQATSPADSPAKNPQPPADHAPGPHAHADAPGAPTTRALGFPLASLSSLPSPANLKTGNTLPTNPATPEHNSKLAKKQFRFLQLIPVPQDGGSSEASPESAKVFRSPELTTGLAAARPASPALQRLHQQAGLFGSFSDPPEARDAASPSHLEPQGCPELESVVDSRSLKQAVHQDKQAFLKFTKAIASVERSSQLDHLSNLACDNIGMLLELKTGNELLQELLRKQHPGTVAKLGTYFSPRLERYTSHELTTKTLYCLAKASVEFRSSLFAWYGQDLGRNLCSNPRVFLLNSIFKVALSTEELAPVKAALSGSVHQAFSTSKTFKRFLISYSEYCEDSELDRLYREWDLAHRIFDLLNDQYKALVLVSFLRRRHPSATSLLLKLVRSRLLDLFGTKFFKLLVIRLCNSNRDSDLLEKLFFALQRIPQPHLEQIARSSSTLYFYLSLMLMTGGSRLADQLAQLDGKLDDLGAVDEAVRSMRATS